MAQSKLRQDGALGNDTLLGSSGDDILYGFDGSDRLIGGSGDDGLYGGAGDDTLLGDYGNDFFFGQAGDDCIDGGHGWDTVHYLFATSGVTVNLSTGYATGGDGRDVLLNIETVMGSDFNDNITGNFDNNTYIEGFDGDDILTGGGTGFAQTVIYLNAKSGVIVALVKGTATGGAGNDTLKNFDEVIGSKFSDIIIGHMGNNVIKAGDGNDTISGGAGYDRIDGGEGTDTAIFSGNYSQYKVNDWVTGPDGNDSLTSIERLQFSDKSIAFDIYGNAGQVYRIYQAAFDRKPDMGGLGDWIYGMDHGMSLLDVSAGFINSPEFQALYGQSPTTSDLVTRLYQNVLHRAPEKAGYDYWVNQIDGHYQTAIQVLTGFSESPENQVQVIGVIQNGIEFTPHQV